MTSIKTLAALLMAGAAFAACSSSDDSIAEQQPVNPTEPKVYTMTVEVSKGENALARAIAEAGSDATTRALKLDGKTLNTTWNEGEKVYVYSKDNTNWKYGELQSAASATGSTTLTGALTEEYQGPAIGKELMLYFPARTVSYGTQLGTIADIAAYRDYSTAEVTVRSRNDDDNTITATKATFTNHQSVVKFTLQDPYGYPINAKSLTIVDPNNKLVIERNNAGTSHGTVGSATITVTPSGDPTSEMYVAISSDGNAMDLTLTATTESGDTYVYQKSGVTFANGQYYAVTVKMPKTIDLSKLDGNYVAQDGDVLTGTLAGRYQISIADGATVTLHNVSINADGAYTNDNWAGITCKGNATIKLKGTNVVKGFKDDYPGIQAGTTGKTLTIQGTDTDKLTASCNGDRMTGACGIGGLDHVACGNIVIEGGDITVEALGAGIGCGTNTTCGDITIKGGIVNATYSSNQVGIGASAAGTCGDITIEGGTVTATGHFDGAGIGAATIGTCGNITIKGGTVVSTGNQRAAGIGTGGMSSQCGNITITTGVTSVTATRGSYTATYCIGLGVGSTGYENSCGTITIGGTEYYNGTSKTWASETLENALKATTFTYPPVPPTGAEVNATMDGTLTEEDWHRD